VLGLVSEVKSNRRADKEPGNEQYAFWAVMLDREHIRSISFLPGIVGKQPLTGISRAVSLRLV
jgi:hypothetical protein